MPNQVSKVISPPLSDEPARKVDDTGTGPRPFLERRKEPRRSDWRPESLLIETGYGERGRLAPQARHGHGHSAPATLVDASRSGLGVEMLFPLILDSVVSVSAQLHGVGGRLELKGSARVVECLSKDEETYRIGLSFLEMESRELPCGQETDSPPAEG